MTYQPRKALKCVVCDAQAVARRLCKRCYYRLRKQKKLDDFALLGPNDVFLERIDKADDCWLWLGTKNQYGYGIFLLPGEKQVRAHRYSYEFHIGPIPKNAIVMHTCDVPACVNPAHLRLGTKKLNNQDAVAKKRHAFGERNGRSVLTGVQIKNIKRDPHTQAAIAAAYGVTQGHISRIKSGKIRTLG